MEEIKVAEKLARNIQDHYGELLMAEKQADKIIELVRASDDEKSLRIKVSAIIAEYAAEVSNKRMTLPDVKLD
ncbi:hypothetical protein ACP3TB_21715 (plasmid) [Rahnella variigena]|uniref:hypothetical protein n=1 Tax=Rahnella variigena TaxID=574964 RepID=UPI003CF67F6D